MGMEGMSAAYRLFAHFKRGFSAVYTMADQNTYIGCRASAVRLLHHTQAFHYAQLYGRWYENRAEPPPLPLDLETLQQEAKRRLGFAFTQTAATAEALYQRGLIRNPQAEHHVIGAQTAAYLLDIVQGLPTVFPEETAAVSAMLVSGEVPRGLMDHAAVACHRMLLPGAGSGHACSALSARQAALYDLICRWFLASFLPAHGYARVTLRWNLGGYRFTTLQDVTVIPGWSVVLADPHFQDWGLDLANLDARQPLDAVDLVEVGAEDPDKPRVFLGPCPKCSQGQVVEMPEIYACNNWRQGCRFRVPRRLLQRGIGREHARQLMEGQATDVIRGFTLASGRLFDARLRPAGNGVVLQPVWQGARTWREGCGEGDPE
jgi:hypothetical protein